MLNSKKKAFNGLWADYDGGVYLWGKGTKTEAVKCAVSKGTYYVKVSDYDVDDGGSVSIKASFKSVKQPTNYCVSKALKLEKNKTATMYQTQDYSFDRWFKITLSANQKVTFNVSRSVDKLDLFDSEGNDVDVKYSSSGKYQTAKLAKGTYFLCVSTYANVGKTDIMTLKWS